MTERREVVVRGHKNVVTTGIFFTKNVVNVKLVQPIHILSIINGLFFFKYRSLGISGKLFKNSKHHRFLLHFQLHPVERA